MYKDSEKDEDLLYLKRLIQIILMPTRSLKSDEVDTEKLGFAKLTWFQRLIAKLQSFVDIKLDIKNRNGYLSVAQKSIHIKNTSERDALIRLVMLLGEECNLAMFLNNLNDLEVFLNTLTP